MTDDAPTTQLHVYSYRSRDNSLRRGMLSDADVIVWLPREIQDPMLLHAAAQLLCESMQPAVIDSPTSG